VDGDTKKFKLYRSEAILDATKRTAKKQKKNVHVRNQIAAPEMLYGKKLRVQRARDESKIHASGTNTRFKISAQACIVFYWATLRMIQKTVSVVSAL
jgi:hypothetical protein